jgi:Fe-S-cluster containining protein
MSALAAVADDALSSLCVECGLCCDGSLFRFLPVEAESLAACAALGLPVVRQSGRDAMPLPCLKLQGRCCTVYEGRPAGCRAFGCHVLHRLAIGALSAHEAQDVVREAQRRIARLRELWPGHEPIVQCATTEALAGQLPDEALRALERVQSWLDARMHWPLS